MQPIRIQESRCVFDGVTSNLPIMHRAYVALFVLATLQYSSFYGMVQNVVQHSLVVYNRKVY